MHQLENPQSQFAQLRIFFSDVKYIILFYVLGDFFTTLHALNYGVEENGFLVLVIEEFGIWAVLVLKIFFLSIVYWNYQLLNGAGTKWTSMLWSASRKVIALVGLFLVINNLMVIFMESSLLNLMGWMAL
ncbi:hypothetical protein V7O66_10105 [Methanolobus sp. ZRKC3]|uniref:hypothetical protein n=1 Tax=Methanolobus sp. ZRKC3 TaxID=3125786 RepID=UPI0032506DFF